MGTSNEILRDFICQKLQISDFDFVEIESKKRLTPRQARQVLSYLQDAKKVKHEKTSFFFDQFLDTPTLDLLRLGASLRIRYKGNGSKVYVQYKGPGFIDQGLLYRSEFSSKKLKHVLLEESHHDVIHFTKTTIQRILTRLVDPAMRKAMRTHLGHPVVSRVAAAPVIAIYQKEKFSMEIGDAYLEPSVDRVFAFHINRKGLHPLSTFYEYENEIKAPFTKGLLKLEHIDELLEFDEKITKKFSLRPERLDKYHRCSSIFLPRTARSH